MLLPTFIAEIKTKSPFGYRAGDPYHLLRDYAEAYGDAVAIHVNPRWGGSIELLEDFLATSTSDKPVIAKGCTSSREVEEVLQLAGGTVDYAHVFGYGDIEHFKDFDQDRMIYEPSTVDQLRYLNPAIHRVMWNARNLVTGYPRENGPSIVEIRSHWTGYLIQASYIKTMADVCPGVNAFIVGEHLRGFVHC